MLFKLKSSSADRFPPQGGQTLPGTDVIEFVSYKRDIMLSLSLDSQVNNPGDEGQPGEIRVLC